MAMFYLQRAKFASQDARRTLVEPDPAALIFASWSRALCGARPENKLKIFTEMAKDAAVHADAVGQQVIDDLGGAA
jgi:hypothetical protein